MAEQDKPKETPPNKMNRRKFIAVAGGAVAAAAIGGAALYYYWPKGEGTEGEGKPLEFDAWAYLTEIINSNVAEFNSEYSENVDLKIVPGNYMVVEESKLMAGTPFDIDFTMGDRAQRWFKAGWTRSFDDQDWIGDMKNDIYGGVLASCLGKSAAGADTVIALPYANQTYCLWRNQKMLGDNGYGDHYVHTKEDLYNICLDLKNKGVCEYPLLIPWGSLDWQLPNMIFAECFSEGEMLFNDALDPTFDTNTEIMHVLEAWKNLWDAQLVPPDVWTWPDAPLMAGFESGQHAFSYYVDTHRIVYRDPSISQIAAYAEWNDQMPGSTGTALNASALYSVSQKNRAADDLTRVMNLAKFLGYKDKNGGYFAAKNYSILGGYFPAYKALATDADILAKVAERYPHEAEWEWQKAWYGNMALPAVYRAFWYPEWSASAITEIYNGVTGAQTLATTITNMRQKAIDLKQVYP
jgi:hypothetical protein